MTEAQAQLQNRATYLQREMKVWQDRRDRAMCTGNKDLIALYINDDMDEALGQMKGELYRIQLELGDEAQAQPVTRRRRRRRAKTN